MRPLASQRLSCFEALKPCVCFLCLLELLSHCCKQTLLALLMIYHLLHGGGRQARFCRRGKDLRLGALVDASLQSEPIGHGAQLLDRQRIVVVGRVGLRGRS